MKSTKEEVAEEQGDFKSGRECVDQVFVLKQLLEAYREKKKEMYVTFVDLEKVNNKVCREELWRVLNECGVDGYLIRSMSSLYDGSRACVRFSSRVGQYFEVRRGLRQGCVMFPWVFSIFFDKVDRLMNERSTGQLREGNGEGCEIKQVLNVDDTMLVVETREHLQHIVNELERASDSMRFKINASG